MESFFDTFFAISLGTLNLFSFMMGMLFAFFNQGLFGKHIGKYLFVYLIGLAAVYGAKYYVANELNKQQTQSFHVPIPK